MIRQAVVASSALSFTHQAVKSRQLPRPLSTRAKGDERSPAEQWLESLKWNSETVPSAITEFKFSRSSGAGGQNVNKYDSSTADARREYV